MREVFSALCSVCCVQCAVFSIQYVVFSVQCSVFSVQYVVFSVQCTVCCISHTTPVDCISSPPTQTEPNTLIHSMMPARRYCTGPGALQFIKYSLQIWGSEENRIISQKRSIYPVASLTLCGAGTWRSSEWSSAPSSCNTNVSSTGPSPASTGTSRYWTVQYSTVQYSTVQYSKLQYSKLQYSKLQYSKLQYSKLQYSKLQYSTVQFTTVPPICHEGSRAVTILQSYWKLYILNSTQHCILYNVQYLSNSLHWFTVYSLHALHGPLPPDKDMNE